MYYFNSSRFLVLIAVVVFVAFLGVPESRADSIGDDAMDTLVTTEWLSQHLDDPDLVVLDCTVRMELDEDGGMQAVSGRADYESGHIPTAGFADLMGDLCDARQPAGVRPADAGAVLRRHGRAGCRRRFPGGAVRRIQLGLGRPGLVDAALGRLRPGGGARWRAGGLDRRGATAVDRAGQPSGEAAHRLAPAGTDRRPGRGVRRHRRRRRLPHRRDARAPFPGRDGPLRPTRSYPRRHQRVRHGTPRRIGSLPVA